MFGLLPLLCRCRRRCDADLIACGVDTVALESTGVYLIPVFEVLEQRGLKVWLIDARQMKYVPGRKSDVLDKPSTVVTLAGWSQSSSQSAWKARWQHFDWVRQCV